MNYNKLSIIKSNNKVVRKNQDKSDEIVKQRVQKKFGENNVYLDQEIKGTFQIRIPNNID